MKVSYASKANDIRMKPMELSAITEIIRGDKLKATAEKIRRLPKDCDEQRAAKADVSYFVPGIFNGTRCDKNLKQLTATAFDCDNLNGRFDVVRAKAVSLPITAMAYASLRRNLKVVTKWSRPITPEEHRILWPLVAEHIYQHIGIMPDSGAKAASQPCFLSHDPDIYFNPDCDALDVDAWLEKVAASKDSNNNKQDPQQTSPDSGPGLSDEEIRELLNETVFTAKNGDKVKKLFNGDWSDDYKSQSEADMALCCHLAFWFDKNPASIERAFRASKLSRPKCDTKRGGQTYLQQTISKAIAATGETYQKQEPERTATESTKETKNSQQKKPTRLTGLCLDELIQKQFPEPKFVVPGILPDGLTILAGKPKKGKSLLALNIAIAVASGGMVLGQRVEQGAVLMLCLEDTYRRLQSRANMMMLYDLPSPETLGNLIFVTEAPRMPGGLLELEKKIIEIRDAGKDLRLIVIDTLAKFRPFRDDNKTGYNTDYSDVGLLKELADKYHTPILPVLHLRKSASVDIFDTVSGSLALTGAADTILILDRGQGTADATLHIIGRDIDGSELALKLDKETLTWQYLGNAEEVRSTTGQQKIVDALKRPDVVLSPKEIELITGLPNNYIRKTLLKLQQDKVVKKIDYGKYVFSPVWGGDKE